VGGSCDDAQDDGLADAGDHHAVVYLASARSTPRGRAPCAP